MVLKTTTSSITTKNNLYLQSRTSKLISNASENNFLHINSSTSRKKNHCHNSEDIQEAIKRTSHSRFKIVGAKFPKERLVTNGNNIIIEKLGEYIKKSNNYNSQGRKTNIQNQVKHIKIENEKAICSEQCYEEVKLFNTLRQELMDTVLEEISINNAIFKDVALQCSILESPKATNSETNSFIYHLEDEITTHKIHGDDCLCIDCLTITQEMPNQTNVIKLKPNISKEELISKEVAQTQTAVESSEEPKPKAKKKVSFSNVCPSIKKNNFNRGKVTVCSAKILQVILEKILLVIYKCDDYNEIYDTDVYKYLVKEIKDSLLDVSTIKHRDPPRKPSKYSSTLEQPHSVDCCCIDCITYTEKSK